MDIHGVFVVGNILGPDLLVILGVVVLLFGGSQIPKLARSLGQAQKEFKAGQENDGESAEDAGKTKPATETDPPTSAPQN